MKQTLWVLALLISACCMSLTGCKPSLPDDVLSQGKMEDILYDYHLALLINKVKRSRSWHRGPR
jgi:hypothetical protein